MTDLDAIRFARIGNRKSHSIELLTRSRCRGRDILQAPLRLLAFPVAACQDGHARQFLFRCTRMSGLQVPLWTRNPSRWHSKVSVDCNLVLLCSLWRTDHLGRSPPGTCLQGATQGVWTTLRLGH